MPSAWTFYEAWQEGIPLGKQLDDIWAQLYPELAREQPEDGSSTQYPISGHELQNRLEARREQIQRTIEYLFQLAQTEKVALLGYRTPKPHGDGPIRITYEALLEKPNWLSGEVKFRGTAYNHVRVIDFHAYSGALLFDPHSSWNPDEISPGPPELEAPPRIEFRPRSPFTSLLSGTVRKPKITGRPGCRAELAEAILELHHERELSVQDGPKRATFNLIRERARLMHPHLPQDDKGMGDQTIRNAWHDAKAQEL